MKNRRFSTNTLYGWLLAAPFVLTLVVFFVFALVRTLYYSFSSYDLFSAPQWVGLSNYLGLFSDPLFITALLNTLAFSLVVTGIQTVLALGMAVILNSRIRAKSFFRTVYYVPSIMSSAAVTLIFIWVYQKNGFLNGLLTVLGANAYLLGLFFAAWLLAHLLLVAWQRRRGLPCSWRDPWLALLALPMAVVVFVVLKHGFNLGPREVEIGILWLGSRERVGPLPLTLWAIVMQNIFTTVPSLMLLFLAGLQSIPGDLYEAADIDGANQWQQLWHVTIPQLAPVTFVVVTVSIIGTLQMFDQVALMGEGVPLNSRITLAYYVYHNAFPDGSVPRIGVASAAALVLGLLTLLVVMLQKRFGIQETQDGR